MLPFMFFTPFPRVDSGQLILWTRRRRPKELRTLARKHGGENQASATDSILITGAQAASLGLSARKLWAPRQEGDPPPCSLLHSQPRGSRTNIHRAGGTGRGKATGWQAGGIITEVTEFQRGGW